MSTTQHPGTLAPSHPRTVVLVDELVCRSVLVLDGALGSMIPRRKVREAYF